MPEKVLTIRGEFPEGTGIWWLDRVVGPDNSVIVQSVVDLGWTLDVYDLSANDALVYSTSGFAPAVIFNTLQLDGFWSVDNRGYQFRHNVPSTAFTHTGGHTYKFEYFLNTTLWGPIPVPQIGDCISSRKV